LQDLDPKVQEVIGRPQTFEITKQACDGLRAAGARSINLDLLYGLPLQTTESVIRTAQKALELSPDRLSVFGYAHVPWMKKHQTLLSESDLPDGGERFQQRMAIDRTLRAAGYVAIGLDHYAKPTDSMAHALENGRLRRNFQGYTDDHAETLIGFGASSIGSLPQGYVANVGGVPAYRKALQQHKLPITRICPVSDEDRLRREVIFRIMCDLKADLPKIAAEFTADADLIADADSALQALAADGIVEWNGAQLRVTETGRPFMRHVAACFDQYFAQGTARHSKSV
jgi:oxygen-independent coproporphyrinogen-3 oxidase